MAVAQYVIGRNLVVGLDPHWQVQRYTLHMAVSCRDKMLRFGEACSSKCCSKRFTVANQRRLDRLPYPPPES